MNAENMAKRTISVLFASVHKETNQNGLIRDPTVSTVVLHLVCHAALYFRVNTHRESKTHINCMFSVLFKTLCTLDLKP